MIMLLTGYVVTILLVMPAVVQASVRLLIGFFYWFWQLHRYARQGRLRDRGARK